ncbi:hypothetical protein CPB97_006756, partial [Podila verticillata]
EFKRLGRDEGKMWKLYGKSAREGYDSLLVAIRKRCKDIQEQQDEMHAEEAVLEQQHE